jgi:UDP:flavonoid glycosyltransferase YjiC (YdhE family)
LNVLLLPFGSHGDVHPFLGLGLALKARGHHVSLAACTYFQELVERTGLDYVELGAAEEFLGLAERPEVWHPRRAFGLIFREGVARILERQYDLVAQRCSRGDTLVVANAFGFAARTAQEKLGVPLVTVHLQPAVLWSAYESPALPGGDFRRLPRWLKRSLFRVGEALFIDRPCLEVLDAFRARHGLPPVRRLARWWNSPECVLGLFPDWFGPPQPDWPPHVYLAQFPLWDEAEVHQPAPEVQAFLEAGDPPLVFTPGSANMQAREFLQAAAEACRLLGRRGMLLTRFPEQVPADLPTDVRHFDYVPFSQVLPRAAAVVHHGGIGSTSQGLRAGIPQLLMPLAHDQPDNAARIVRLGVGDWLAPAKFRSPAVAEKLATLVGSSSVRDRCREVAARFDGVDPFEEACRAVERFGEKRAGRT